MPTSIPNTTVLVYDEAGNLALEGTYDGGTIPTTASTFALGCRLTNTASGTVYINTGTVAAPVWETQEAIDNPEETILATGTLSSYGASTLDSAAGAITGTLGDGAYVGQIKTIVMQDATASSTVSITNHQTSDPEVATFDAVDETGVFMWTGTEWITIFATCTFV